MFTCSTRVGDGRVSAINSGVFGRVEEGFRVVKLIDKKLLRCFSSLIVL